MRGIGRPHPWRGQSGAITFESRKVLVQGRMRDRSVEQPTLPGGCAK